MMKAMLEKMFGQVIKIVVATIIIVGILGFVLGKFVF